MENNTDQPILNRSQLFALQQGAVVTTPVLVTPEEYRSAHFKPGKMLEFRIMDDPSASVLCTILDIEKVRQEKGDTLNVRVTIQKPA